MDVVDYISLHHYGGSTDTAKEIHDASKLEHEIKVLDAVITSVASKNEKKERVKIAADEWNIWFRSWFKRGDDHKLEEIYNLRDALSGRLRTQHLSSQLPRGADGRSRPTCQRDRAYHG